MTSPFGPGVVFLNVLLDQLGLPLPAVPLLVVAGTLVADQRLSGTAVTVLALSACVLADSSWYAAGRWYGGRVMKLLCRISLTPDICVSQTQTTFERWGARALLFAKFLPGLSLIAPPLAGALRMSFVRFTLFSAIGSALWVGAALLAGVLLRPQIERLLPRIASAGSTALLLLLALLALYIAYKWWARRRFFSALEMARIGVAELHARLHGDASRGAVPPVVVDVRSATALELNRRRIPGALHVSMHEVAQHLAGLPHDREIVFYCTCPNEASAAQAARVLMNYGFKRVRPLQGGLDAWIAAGYTVEEPSDPATAAPAVPLPVEPAAAEPGR